MCCNNKLPLGLDYRWRCVYDDDGGEEEKRETLHVDTTTTRGSGGACVSVLLEGLSKGVGLLEEMKKV